MAQVAVSAPRTIAEWSLFEHVVEGDKSAAANATPWTPTPLTPKLPAALTPAYYAAIGFTVDTAKEDAGLQALIKKNVLDKSPKLKAMRFAVADLSQAGKIAYAGNNLAGPKGDPSDLRTCPDFGGSLIKVVNLLAAYQLMYDLNALAKTKGLKTRDDLYAAAYDGWVATQDPTGHTVAPMAAGSILELNGRLIQKAGKRFKLTFAALNGVQTWSRTVKGKPVPFVDGAPNLDDIFDVTPGTPAQVAFKQSADPEAGGQNLGEFADVAGKPFYDRMYAMCHMSNNGAAASLAMDIGYNFVNSVLIQSGLWSPLLGGLFLGASYPGLAGSVLWIQNPMPQHDQVNVVGGKRVVNTSRRFQVGSPVAVTALFALLARGRLVSPHASAEMLYLLNRRKHKWVVNETTWSPLLDSMNRHQDAKHSKLGLVGNSVGDGVFTKRKSDSGKPIQYVATLIDFPDTSTGNLFQNDPTLIDLAVGIDQAIEENNP